MAIHANCTTHENHHILKTLILNDFFKIKRWHGHCNSTHKFVIP